MRDAVWLDEQLKFLLSKYFSNVNIKNPLEIKWGREAKYRFGTIKLEGYPSGNFRASKSVKGFFSGLKTPKKSVVTITSMFKDEKVPVGVVQYTIAHELCHYAHGFSSMNRRMFRFPHHGGVINRELTERGAHNLIPIFKIWLKEYRKEILAGRQSI